MRRTIGSWDALRGDTIMAKKQNNQRSATAVLDDHSVAELDDDPIIDPTEPIEPPVISVNILTPTPNAEFVVTASSATIPVSGTVRIDFGAGTSTGVKVRLGDSGTFQTASRSGDSWSFSASVSTARPLLTSAEATAYYRDGILPPLRPVTQTTFVDVIVRLDPAPPSLAITSLPLNNQVTGPDQLFKVPIAGTASDDS